MKRLLRMDLICLFRLNTAPKTSKVQNEAHTGVLDLENKGAVEVDRIQQLIRWRWATWRVTKGS